MKKLFFIALLACTQIASAQGLYPRAVLEIKLDAVGNSPQNVYSSMPATGVKCIRVLDGDKTNINFAGLDCYNMGPSFSYNSSTNQIDVVGATQANADWAANSGPAQILNKPTTLAGYGITDALTASAVAAGFYAKPTGTVAQYIRGDGSLAAFPAAPVVPVINRAIITTATDGTYTWTFPTACSGTAVVSVTPQNNVSGEVINHKVTAVSATSMTVSTSRAVLTLNALLGLTIPVIQTNSAQTLHLMAVCP